MSVYKLCPSCKEVHDWSVPCKSMAKAEQDAIDHGQICAVLFATSAEIDGVDHGHRVGPCPNLSQYDGDRSDL